MEKKFHPAALLKNVIILSIALIIILACSSKQKNSQKSKFSIVTTTGMIGDLAKNIAGDKIEVEALMGPGVDPHLYKASQGDIARLSNADVIFYNGLHLEGKMTDIFAKMSRKKTVVAVSDDIDKNVLITWQNQQGIYDPHIWFDVSLWRQTIPLVMRTIAELDSQNSDYYRNNADGYAAKLDSLHNWIIEYANAVPSEQRIMITAHDAFSYFGRAYNIEVHGLQGISTVAEYGVNDVINLADLIIEKGIKAVFIETSVPHRSIEAVVAACKARNYNVKIGGSLYSDAMGAPGSGADSYIGMVTANVKTIVEALK